MSENRQPTWDDGRVIDDFEGCYRLMQSRDPRYDGFFVVGVTSTHVYCRPSCPARTPYRRNVRLFRTVAAAQQEGFRACKRCDPDAAPGSLAWNRRAGVAGRAMRLIADGTVERDGVSGLAARLHFSERQLNRILTAELGAGPVALARAQRAQSARTLIETTELPFGEVAVGAGFGSVRQFNDTLLAVYGRTPTKLRAGARRHSRENGGSHAPHARGPGTPGAIELRLPCREPFDGESLVAFLAARAIPGIEEVEDLTYRRTLALEHGPAVIALTPATRTVRAELRLADLRDLTAAVARCRRLLDLDADPVAISSQLGDDPALAPLVSARPGLRVPGCVDGFELGVRAIVGQQVSVAAARTVLGRLVAAHGEELTDSDREHALRASTRSPGGLTHRFPGPTAFAELDPASLPFPRRRAEALRAFAGLVASGELHLDPGADAERTRARLMAIPGVGGWTASYVAMRALADPDVFLPGDIGIRHALARLGAGADHRRWRPWRSYAVVHLWRSLDG
jgi:AraC family transcriptional regulator, regulatory protein of adaptative response / DNA-3-methyladenine glycosylase II